MTDRNNKDRPDREADIKSLSESYRDTEKDAYIKKEISSFSNMSPEVVAQLIRSWMNSENE